MNGYMLFDPLTNKDDVKCFAAVATSLNNTYPHADRSRNLYNMVIKGMKNTRTPRQTELDIPQDKIKEATIIDIELKDIKGNVRRLTDLKGKVILIDFTVYNNAMSAAHNLALRELISMHLKDWKSTRFRWMPMNISGRRLPIICRGFVCVTLMEHILSMLHYIV